MREDATLATWAGKWIKERRARAVASVRSDESRVRIHVLPELGRFGVAEITREQIEGLVEKLDAKVRAGELSWKTAGHVWVLVSKMFDDAARSKTLALRVRKDNPAADVRGPDRGAVKAKSYLYPSKLQKLMMCQQVPLYWRRLVAVAVYTFMRAGELEALEWSDVDVERGVIHVHRSADREGPRKESAEGGSRTRLGAHDSARKRRFRQLRS